MNKKLVFFMALLLLPLLVLGAYGMPALGTAAAAQSGTGLLGAGTVFDALEATLGQIYEDVTPSVVNIRVTTGSADLQDHPQVPGLPLDPSLPQQGLGSGFVWDQEGHIVTNNHVVDGATRITVTFYDDTTVPAEVIGTDPHSDLAVIKVDLPSDKLHPVRVADSTEVRVGQLAVAIGNPFGLEGTMTVGFISALGRSLPVAASALMAPTYTIPDIIQTDAPINPGNSGGVLVNDEGQVVGVPTAIESPVQANAGVGFAVPSAIVQKVVPVLIQDGRYEHAWLGISGTSLDSRLAGAMDLDPDQRGVLVAEVVDGSPAAEAGLQGSDRQIELDGIPVGVGGDLITAIDGQPVTEFEDLVTYLARSTRVGDTVTLTFLREGQERTARVTLAARPQEQASAGAPVRSASLGAWLGIRGVSLTPELAEAMDLPSGQQGVLVAEVIQGTPADRAGLLGGDQLLDLDGQQVQIGGDVIIAVDGEPVSGFEQLKAFLQQSDPGQEVTLTLLRDGKEMSIGVVLGEMPSSTP